MNKCPRVHARLAVGVLFLFSVLACSANRSTYSVQSQLPQSKPSDEIINVAPSRMVKDAIRLQGKLLSEMTKKDGWFQYKFLVKRTVKYGATFASVEPSPGEELILNVSKKLAFSSGSILMVDVTTPKKRSEGSLMVFKVSDY